MALDEQVRLALEEDPKATAEDIAKVIGEPVGRVWVVMAATPKKKAKAK